jgi:hypothetical protein
LPTGFPITIENVDEVLDELRLLESVFMDMKMVNEDESEFYKPRITRIIKALENAKKWDFSASM